MISPGTGKVNGLSPLGMDGNDLAQPFWRIPALRAVRFKATPRWVCSTLREGSTDERALGH